MLKIAGDVLRRILVKDALLDFTSSQQPMETKYVKRIQIIDLRLKEKMDGIQPNHSLCHQPLPALKIVLQLVYRTILQLIISS